MSKDFTSRILPLPFINGLQRWERDVIFGLSIVVFLDRDSGMLAGSDLRLSGSLAITLLLSYSLLSGAMRLEPDREKFLICLIVNPALDAGMDDAYIFEPGNREERSEFWGKCINGEKTL